MYPVPQLASPRRLADTVCSFFDGLCGALLALTLPFAPVIFIDLDQLLAALNCS
jgi:hypothetical protein